MEKGFLLQLFAGIDDVISSNSEAFEGTSFKDEYGKVATKLEELGYDVLINHKQKAEFIPSSRLSEVVAQRDTFKGQVEQLNKDLESMREAASGNTGLQEKYQALIDKNQELLDEIEQSKVEAAIALEANDAVDVKDLLLFVNRDSIKVNSKGQIVGVETEVERLRNEKPYLFKGDGQGSRRKGGHDSGSGRDDSSLGLNMNARIRKAAGR